MTPDKLSRKQIDESLKHLDFLCREEYGKALNAILQDDDRALSARRLRRLVGVFLKRHFAYQKPVDEGPTETGAKRAWVWNPVKLTQPSDDESSEFLLLDRMREELPNISGDEPTWEAFQHQAEHERGLFKVLALYVKDKLEKCGAKSIREYYQENESKNFKALLDIGNAVFNFSMTPVYASILPVPGLVVAFALIGIEFGHDSIFDADEEPDRNE